MFRSCAQGYLHSVVLGEAALEVDAATLADAILAAAQASHRNAHRTACPTESADREFRVDAVQ